MQRKPLAPPAKSNKQVQEYIRAVKRGQNGYYVAPAKIGWNVRKASDTNAGKHYFTKMQALAYAKKSVDTQADVVLYNKDGSVIVVEVKSGKR